MGGGCRGDFHCRLPSVDQSKPPEVIQPPSGLLFDDTLESFRRKYIAPARVGNRNAAAIWMRISFVAPGLPPEFQSVMP